MGKNKSIQSYKGFDKNMQCRGFQFEEGMEYKHDGPVVACESGFHACENPLDVLFYYPPTNGNRYAETEQSGKLSHHEQDSKLASERIKIKAEINLTSIISAAVNFVCEKTKSIQESNAATTGKGSNAATTGEESISAGLGIENAAKGVIGNWLVLAEWYYDDNKWHIKSVKSSIVDGKKIKADTFYTLKNGKFVEAKS